MFLWLTSVCLIVCLLNFVTMFISSMARSFLCCYPLLYKLAWSAHSLQPGVELQCGWTVLTDQCVENRIKGLLCNNTTLTYRYTQDESVCIFCWHLRHYSDLKYLQALKITRENVYCMRTDTVSWNLYYKNKWFSIITNLHILWRLNIYANVKSCYETATLSMHNKVAEGVLAHAPADSVGSLRHTKPLNLLSRDFIGLLSRV